MLSYDVQNLISSLPSEFEWIEQHLKEDLLPFWTMESAFGKEPGDFPTLRCNNGRPASKDDPILKNADPALVDFDKEYIRMKSRQTYAYGVGYHLTGDERLLRYAKDGVEYIRKNALYQVRGNKENLKGSHTYYSKSCKEWGPETEKVTSQDLSYSLMGLAFYYYLTRDVDVEKDIIAVKDYVFEKYFDKDLGLMKWVLTDPNEDGLYQKELVGILDQITAYMMLVTPFLPQKESLEWKKDLQKISHIMIKQFFSFENNLFWGAITNDYSNFKQLGTHHTDFGHSIKSMWMIYQIGKMTDDLGLIEFSMSHAPNLFKTAYLPEVGAWARAYDHHGNIDKRKEWWIYAELNQMAATMSLVDPFYATYLTNTYSFWFNNMVDKKDKEVWHMLKENNQPDLSFPKQHIWKNSFHSFEHALIGYITCQQLKNKNVTLYYAFPHDNMENIRAYIYNGKVRNIEKLEKISGNLVKYKYEISDIR